MMFFNYSITADTLPSPIRSDCKTEPSLLRCYVASFWFDDGTSSVAYSADNPNLPETVLTITQRSVNTSGAYVSPTSVGYNCMSTDTTPCDTVDKLKRIIISTSFPTDEQMKQFDSLIVPTLEFNSSSCFNYSNLTDPCPETDLTNCQQSTIYVDYAQQAEICAACPSGKIGDNLINHQTLFYLNNQTQHHRASIHC